ncbi:Phage portal protein, HK97 [uncultured Caudovirales phage]|uniref:Phage portal protein, HK97 n=1 Tax=uncultured Caudovirales phage TaxID=2100421 RepID=A0A6J5S481_9CAUD|nr:Phage portal protein, HK97 [uncultured Caudovirales phage]CAB4203275.1 Phage portal protein, HK97 [uncultured Caudovirales phage]
MAIDGILSRIFGGLTRQASTPVAIGFEENSPVGMPVSAGVQGYISNWADTGRYITPELARQSPSVYACTMLISQSIARMEWKVYKVEEEQMRPLPNHPLYHLLNIEPNPFMGALTWRQSMLMDCLLYGNGYSYIERDASGRPIRLEKLRPDLMNVQRAADNSVVYHYAAGIPGSQVFNAYDIFHLIGPSADGLIGEPPIYLARQMIGVEIEAEAFVASFFQNGARPAGVLQVQGTLSPEAYTRLRDSWQAMQGGSRNAGRVAILESGYEFKQVSINPDDAQLIELRRYCREQIAAAFGVPPHMVGDSSKQSYSSAEQADLEFTKHTLGTWVSRLEEETIRKLIRPGDQVRTAISFDALTRGDLGGRFNAYATALQHGFLSINEVRSREGMGPVLGGENLRVPLQLGPLPTTTKESDAPTSAEAQASGVGQLQAMSALAAMVAKGEIPAEAASGIIAAAFPLIGEADIAKIISPLADAARKPKAAPPPPGGSKPTPTDPSPPEPTTPAPAPTPANPSPTDPASAGELSRRDCGSGAGGFQPGNECGKGGTGGDDISEGSDAGIPAAADLTKVGNLGGSTGAMLAKDKDGNQYVVKEGNSPEHIRSEAAANDIYAAAGVPVPAHSLDESDSSAPKQITKFVEGTPIGNLSGAKFEAAASQLREHFAADALMANWDVIGLNGDNVLVPKDGGPPQRVDNGGSLTFRAQGGPKAFGPKVGELESMRTSDQGRRVFGKLNNNQIAAQIRDLGRRRSSIVRAAPKELRETISARLDYMERWAKENGARSKGDATTIILDYVEETDEERDCGTGAGGFQPGNACGQGGGGGAEDGKDGEGKKDAKAPGKWMEKKPDGYTTAVQSVGEAKLHACLAARYENEEGMTKKEAQVAAIDYMLDTPQAAMMKDFAKYGINPESAENMVKPSTLKNDPGIYAKDKAIAAGLIKPAASGSQSNKAPIEATPTAPPKQSAAAPVAPSKAKDPEDKADQPIKTKGKASTTPGIPPEGKLPTGHDPDWTVETPTPKVTAIQEAVVNNVALAKEAVNNYSQSGYNELNAQLRKNSTPTKDSLYAVASFEAKEAAMVAALDAVTRCDKRDPPPATVYRGSGEKVMMQIDKLGVGDTFVDHGFMSTSTRRAAAESFGGGKVMMRISTRQGISIKAWSSHKNEEEVLLPRGSRFKVKTKEWRYIQGRGRVLVVDLEHMDTNH